jgi:hypothetical protein
MRSNKTKNAVFNNITMKKLIICLTVSAFALVSSHAGDSKPCTGKDKAACSDKKACCSEKSMCSKGAPSKNVLMSPKAAAQAGK